ncbi:hypothetical protein ACFP2F_09445 [Hymenobacter artigasi]|uniref:Uncharacterized protein n=1 Tax=Hymenobacter artigasi TaxID=2719616 RepID=A0ABX1HL40_9BACT|nr:hypothetical protein [Hymenobacter artigasi]NKI89752.1 hypothetical protein [Hymenobacter artigasi]
MLNIKFLMLSVLVWGGIALPVHGQGRDTAFAVHKLFVQRRHGADALLAAAGEMAASTTVSGAVSGLVAGAAPAAVGLVKSARYSTQREANILNSYANGWPIPADVRRKLRRKHFHRTVKDVMPGR